MTDVKINPLRAERFIIITKSNSIKHKLFQIIFNKKGCLFINFPYYKNSKGIVSIVKFPANIHGPTDLSLEPDGKVTSHLVKYTHHIDGEAHFSQTGKVKTEIRKKAIPLHEIEGHIFTIMLQGVECFDKVKQRNNRKLNYVTLSLDLKSTDPDAIKIVGQLYSHNELINKFSPKTRASEIGPKADINRSGTNYKGILLSSPLTNPSKDKILLLTSEPIPRIDESEDSALTFIGGFDPHSTVEDLKISTSFLALSYPLTTQDFEKLKDRLGSIDLLKY